MRLRFGRVLVGIALTSATAALAAGVNPGIGQLLGRARLVVAGEVADVAEYDSGRFTVARVRVQRVFKGDTAPGSDVLVVERHDMPSSAELLRAGERAVAFLAPAARTSSLKAALPAGSYYEIVAGRAGVLTSSRTEDIDEAVAIVGRIDAANRTPLPDTQRQAAVRALVFDEIAARHPLLVADGVRGLSGIADLSKTVTPQEQVRLEAALRRTDLPAWIRIALVNAIADGGLTRLLPALQALSDPNPEVQRAVWKARTRLGAAPSEDDLKPALTSDDPAIRAEAVRALTARMGAAGVAQTERIALTDPDRTVRIAALDALGALRLPVALPSLERAFADPEPSLRQAAGRAIHTIGGRPAAESFARLAFQGPPDAQKYAVLLLLMSGVTQEDPLVVRIRETHPDESVRHLLTEGPEIHKH
ncbi:HEAT repeat domain-containing protein [Candidatus Binatia bacterium]|nr:HEAT repeat domain-containing protein [Candidatus Binatia bacterium]